MSYSERAVQYTSGRPSYPDEVINFIIKKSPKGAVVADIGAGTGKLTKLLAGYFPTVYAIEPDEGMRNVLSEFSQSVNNIITLDGSAEHTKLDDNSIDVVCAAQAFHWFKEVEFRNELNRILRPGGKIFIIHNVPPVITLGITLNKNENRDSIETMLINRKMDRVRFFGDKLEFRTFSNSVVYSKERFIEYFISLSTGPDMEDEEYVRRLIDKIGKEFDKISKDNLVTLPFVTELYTTRGSYK